MKRHGRPCPYYPVLTGVPAKVPPSRPPPLHCPAWLKPPCSRHLTRTTAQHTDLHVDKSQVKKILTLRGNSRCYVLFQRVSLRWRTPVLDQDICCRTGCVARPHPAEPPALQPPHCLSLVAALQAPGNCRVAGGRQLWQEDNNNFHIGNSQLTV